MRSGTIILKKQILEQRTLLKRLVRLHLRDLFLMRQPITLVIIQGGNRLRIELEIIDRLGIVYPFTSIQMKRRLPEGSPSKSVWLLVAIKEA